MEGPRDDRRGGDSWIEITSLHFGPGGRALDHTRSEDWSLALRAAGLPHRVRRLDRGFGVFVPPAVLEQALAEVGRFEAENPPGEAEAPPPPPPPLVPAGFGVAAVLAAAAGFFVLTASPGLLGMVPETWLAAGTADSGRILEGRWELAVTALFLHAGPAHFLANAAFGGVLLHALGRELRVGGAALLFLLAGAAGNLLNAAAHGPGHLSIGASTGVFGLVGGLAALRAARDGRITLRRAFAPVAAGVALLAMLGAEGQDTDLLAHAFGFLAGLGLGLPAGLALRGRPAPGRGAGYAAAALAVALAALAWTAALGRAPLP